MGGDLEIWLEDEKHVVNKSCLIFIPAGMKHCPLRSTRVDRPYIHFALGTEGSYLRGMPLSSALICTSRSADLAYLVGTPAATGLVPALDANIDAGRPEQLQGGEHPAIAALGASNIPFLDYIRYVQASVSCKSAGWAVRDMAEPGINIAEIILTF